MFERNIKEESEREREKIKANPKRSLKKSDKPHHLLCITYSCNSCTIVPRGHSKNSSSFSKRDPIISKAFEAENFLKLKIIFC